MSGAKRTAQQTVDMQAEQITGLEERLLAQTLLLREQKARIADLEARLGKQQHAAPTRPRPLRRPR